MPWVKQLSISANVASENNLQKIHSLSGLTDLAIHACGGSNFGKLRAIHFKGLPIETLKVPFTEAISTRVITDISTMFNLENVTTFELHFWFMEEYPESFEPALRRLFTNLINVHSICLISQFMQYDQLFNIFKPNSLHTFYLRIMKKNDAAREIPIWNMLKNQDQKLCRLYASYDIGYEPHHRWYGLAEFDKVFKSCREELVIEEIAWHVSKIRSWVKDPKSFPELKQVIIDGSCYFIKRAPGQIINIIPVNNVASSRSRMYFE